MTTSGLQTIKSAATFPRMCQAAPFEACSILLLLLMFFAAPLLATSVHDDEVGDGLGVCYDKLRATYHNNQPRLERAWNLRETGVSSEQLLGNTCDASNYGMHVESVQPPVVLIVYHKRFDYQSDSRYWRISLDDGKIAQLEGAAPDGVGQSPWPPDRALHEDRLRGFWWRAHRSYYFAGLSLTAVIAGAWLVLRNKWFSLRAPN